MDLPTTRTIAALACTLVACNSSPYGVYLRSGERTVAASALGAWHRCPDGADPELPRYDILAREPPPAPTRAQIAAIEVQHDSTDVADFQLLAKSDEGIACINVILPDDASVITPSANDEGTTRPITPEELPCDGHSDRSDRYADSKFIRFRYSDERIEQRPTFRLARYRTHGIRGLYGWIYAEAFTFDGTRIGTEYAFLFGPSEHACAR